jgi:hypothetical protein
MVSLTIFFFLVFLWSFRTLLPSLVVPFSSLFHIAVHLLGVHAFFVRMLPFNM